MNARAALSAAAAILAVVLVGLGILAYHQYAVSSATGVAIGGPFKLVDGDGKTVTDQDLRGKWLVVYFGYTHCPDACPTALNAIALAVEKLPAGSRANVQPVFITVDPDRDTPAVMKDYVAAFGSSIIGLTGDQAALDPVEKAYRVYSKKHPNPDGSYDMDHSSIVYVMGPDGHYVTNFTSETSATDMAIRLMQVVS